MMCAILAFQIVFEHFLIVQLLLCCLHITCKHLTEVLKPSQKNVRCKYLHCQLLLGEFSGIAWGSLMQYFSAYLWTKWAQ